MPNLIGHIAICPKELGILQYAQEIEQDISQYAQLIFGHIEKSNEYVAIRETIQN